MRAGMRVWMCVSVCVCARARTSACVCACVFVCVYARTRICVYTCLCLRAGAHVSGCVASVIPFCLTYACMLFQVLVPIRDGIIVIRRLSEVERDLPQ